MNKCIFVLVVKKKTRVACFKGRKNQISRDQMGEVVHDLETMLFPIV